MIRYISLDMDGTLVNSKFVDMVWMQGIPQIYSEKYCLDLHEAKEFVIGEYMKIGSEKIEWYDMAYWLNKFQLNVSKWEVLKKYQNEIEPYPEVFDALELFTECFDLVVTSNAAREFIDLELNGFKHYFAETFSATSDFNLVKKSPLVYESVCRKLKVKPFEVLHIGDHYIYDYESSIEAGLDALFLDRKSNRTGREVVWDLREAFEKICSSA
jgi:HAD superfamily hydrolase (TIGR01549 family)